MQVVVEKVNKNENDGDNKDLDTAVERITIHLKNQFDGAKVNFLWERDGLFRFRINRFGLNSEGNNTILACYFVVAEITPDGVVYEIKKDKKNGN